MKALVLRGKSDLRGDTVPDPVIEDPSDVVVDKENSCVRVGQSGF